jgi:hypothetical protein
MSWAERIAKAAAEEAVNRCNMKGYQGEGRGGKGSGKSKGGRDGKGGSGKSKGKGKGLGSTEKPQWWQCQVLKCIAHCKTAHWNHPGREACQVCMQPKCLGAKTAAAEKDAERAKLREAVAADNTNGVKGAAAVAVVRKNADAVAQMRESTRLEVLSEMAKGIDTGLSKGAQKRIKSMATADELRAAGLPVPRHKLDALKESDEPSDDESPMAAADGDDGMAVAAKKSANSTPLERYGIAEDRLSALGLPWSKFVSLRGAYALPRELPPQLPSATVSKILQGEASEAISAKQTAVAKLLGATEGLRQSLGEKDDIYLQSCARLKADTEDLQRMIKKAAPKKNASQEECAKATSLRLKLAKQEAESAHAERVKRYAAGKLSANERHTADLHAVDELIAELEERKTLLKDHFKLAEDAWEEMTTASAKHDVEVIRLLDVKIKAVGPLVEAKGTPAGGQEVAEPGLAEPSTPADATSYGGRYEDLQLTAEGVQPEDIPTLVIKDATEEEKKTLGEVWEFLEAVRMTPMGTPTPPSTFAQMGLPHVSIAQLLVSKEVWTKFYGGQRQVGPMDLVPWHLMELIRLALEKAKTELTGGQERKNAAAERLNTARTAAKCNSFCPW